MIKNKSEITELIDNAQMILVGIGEELQGDSDCVNKAYKSLEKLLKDRNYYIVTTNSNGNIAQYDFEENRFVEPCVENADETRWEHYTKWLQGTLNRQLVLLELGVGFKTPTVIRWPFEKITYFNLKAKLVRVHQTLFQLPKEVQERGQSVQMNAVDFLVELQ